MVRWSFTQSLYFTKDAFHIIVQKLHVGLYCLKENLSKPYLYYFHVSMLCSWREKGKGVREGERDRERGRGGDIFLLLFSAII